MKQIKLFLFLVVSVQQLYSSLARVPAVTSQNQLISRLPQVARKHTSGDVKMQSSNVSTKQLSKWANVEPGNTSWAAPGIHQSYLKGVKNPHEIHSILKEHSPELWKKHSTRMLKLDGVPKQVGYYKGDVKVGGLHVDQELHDEILRNLQSARRVHLLQKRAPEFLKKHSSKFLKKDGSAKKIYYDSSINRFHVGGALLPRVVDDQLQEILASDLSKFLQGKNIFKLLLEYAPEVVSKNKHKFYKLDGNPKQIKFDGFNEEFRVGGQVIPDQLNDLMIKSLESARLFSLLEEWAPDLLVEYPERFYTKAGVPKKVSYNLENNELRLGGQLLPSNIEQQLIQKMHLVAQGMADNSVLISDLTDMKKQQNLSENQSSRGLVSVPATKNTFNIQDYFRAQKHDQMMKSQLRKSEVKQIPSHLQMAYQKSVIPFKQDVSLTPYAVGVPVSAPYVHAPIVPFRKEIGLDPYKVGVLVGEPYADDQLMVMNHDSWYWNDNKSLLPALAVVAGTYGLYKGYKELMSAKNYIKAIAQQPASQADQYVEGVKTEVKEIETKATVEVKRSMIKELLIYIASVIEWLQKNINLENQKKITVLQSLKEWLLKNAT